ncbi:MULTISPECIES: NUMOD4 domain-containing protein [unclassified Staphylococcus]|uniref:NUMOD4 domain-containing protein n=1 Tax=unclassified Staphylococcus TaxID=91994 RepID=UPI001AEC2E26|nr:MULTISPECIES: NUMOD4 domain-containing protein [unclassified Staphylococcus]
MEEIWSDIEGYEGYYKVSNKGNIKSLKRTVKHGGSVTRTFPELILKPNKVNFGYLQVTLNKNGKRKSRYVHNLVMESFKGPKKLGYEVNHIDENKENNNLENLEYLTSKENNNYGKRIEMYVNSATNGKRSKKIRGTHIITGETVEFPSISEAKRQGYGNHISDVIHGKRNHTKKFKWEFI